MPNQPSVSKQARRVLALAFAVAAGMFLSANSASAQKSPEEAMKSLKVADGLELTLWSSEPQFVNPTNIDVDARGRVWVLEAANYRKSKTRPEGDRIMILEDTDHDGKADSSKVFYQDKSLNAPLGIHVMGDKVYVAQSPNLMVFTIDASGDKPAGPPQVLLTGFGGVDHDHGLHSGVFGPDGRFYFNAGNDGMSDHVRHPQPGQALGDKVHPEVGAPVVDATDSELGGRAKRYRGQQRKGGGYRQGMAFRMDLDGKNVQTLGHNFRNNYELTVDAFGTVWQSDNDDDGNQGVRLNFVMEGGDFGYTGPKGTGWQRDLPLIPGQSHQEAQWHQRWPGVVPNLIHTGGGSPCGIAVYEGNLLPERFRGAILHADAGPNVVHAFITTPTASVPTGLMPGVKSSKGTAAAEAASPGGDDKPGAGYRAEAVELIKSKGDSWFRPCDVTVAPDGSVFVADWYDPGVGGHATGDPKTEKGEPKAWQKMSGRIYRVAPPGFKPSPVKLDLDSVAGQVAGLKSPNVATRYLAWNKLNEGGEAANKALADLYANDKDSRARARALWLLAKSKDGKKHVETALKDNDADLRVTAVRAARLIKLDIPAIAEQLVNDSAPQVLRELAIAMNYEPAEKAIPALVKLADRYDGKDRWYLEAIGIGALGKEDALLEAWQKDGKNKGEAAIAEKLAWRLKRITPDAKQAGAKEESRRAAVPFAGREG